MSSHMVTILVSLDGPVQLLKAAMEEFGWRQASLRGARFPAEKYLNYNCSPFMMQLVAEIFAYSGDNVAVGKALSSTNLLMTDGLESAAAQEVAARVFTAALDCIVSAVPVLPFGQQEGFQYDFCDPSDLMIGVHKAWLEATPSKGVPDA